MSSLTVYKASAGSGKTFTLAVAYIKLLVAKPSCFKNILAVTFTNKATDEMKTRILSQLYGISKDLPDSAAYLDKIAAETGMTKPDIRTAAKMALTLLIHNYDYFHVETIDTFFQSVLRNLARELDLSANLKVELNDISVESQAVDLMIEELDKKSPLFIWLVKFIMESIDENNSWNIIGSVKDFGKMIFNDNYRVSGNEINNKLSDDKFVASFRTKLRALVKDLRDSLVEIRDRFFTLTEAYGLSDGDFKGGQRSGIQNYFYRLTDEDLSDRHFLPTTVANCLADEENWTTKSNKKRDVIIAAAKESLIPLLEHAEKSRLDAQRAMTSVDATLKNLNNLRLLRDIENKVKAMNAEANRFLLSDTQHLLRLMIDDTDSPFIFEKIGTRLEHIMIDEFQDTSAVQWGNFKVLLNECLSHSMTSGNGMIDNLIVGDIKQSIYRWRSGDWRLLNNIEKAFPNYLVEIETLDTNFRSQRNIIAFNNAFFKTAIDVEFANECKTDESQAELIKSAYADVVQNAKKDESSGQVSVSLLNCQGYEEKTLQSVADTIFNILGHGCKQSDIAILLRTNKYIPMVADFFTENYPELNIVSDEAFRLDHSTAVNCIIDALRYLYNDKDVLTKACLVKNYSLATGKEQLSSDDMMKIPGDDTSLLPAEYTDHMEDLRELPLLELCEKLMDIFNLYDVEGEGAYICTFFDCISAYINDMSADATGFIREWDDNLHSRTIQTDGIDGIRLISIHKSKGLEFDNVIVPFCDWKMEHNNRMIWCHPKVAPFNELPLIPVNCSSRLANSIYSDDYKEEHMQNTIDNLNLLYVAFTRPKRNLFVFGKRKAAGTRSMLIEKSLEATADALEGATVEGMEDEDEDITFSFGEFCRSEYENEEQSENVFLQTDMPVTAHVEYHEMPLEFKQSNNSRKFIEENSGEPGDSATGKADYIKTGNILHQIFSNIRVKDDIEEVLNRYEAEGILYGDELNRDKLETMLNKRLTGNRLVEDWFSGRWTLFNECTIICEERNGENGTSEIVSRRPDRVMKDGSEVVVVDFKFGAMRDEYTDQVRSYIRYMNEMGYENVKGYLWFVYKNEIKEVTL